MKNPLNIIFFLARARFPAAALLAVFLMGLPGGAEAQFSDTWEFMKAVEERDYKEMRTRIFAGANINTHNPDGLTAVIIATDAADSELLRFLVDQGANINSRTQDRGETGLMRRAERGDREFVGLMIDLGADVNAEDRGGETPLIKAARNRHWRVVSLLIDSGADVNHADYTGRTALDYARQNRARRSERLLENAGAT